MTGTHKHFLFAVSSHGYGHLAQLAPVINYLTTIIPEAVISIQSSLPFDIIASRINAPFKYICFDADVGLVMDDAVTVQVSATAAAYKKFHKHWDSHYQQQIEILQNTSVDILIADIPYLPLLAAQELGIKTIALCSLNWVDILSAYIYQDQDINEYLELMRKAYTQADIFLKPEPSMPMPWLSNSHTIEPLVTLGNNRRTQLMAELSLDINQETILVLLALGGINSPLSLQQWPDYKNVHLLVQDGHADADINKDSRSVSNINASSLAFADIVQSVDVIITKPGYGLFAEAAFGAKPVFYVARGDWPEEIYLLQWLGKYVPLREISREHLVHGVDEAQIKQLFAQKTKDRISRDGAREAVDCIVQVLKHRG